MDSVRRPRGDDDGIREVVASAIIARPPGPPPSARPKQRRRGRTGWPLAEAEESAGIPEADLRAIQTAITEWSGRAKRPRRPRGSK